MDIDQLPLKQQFEIQVFETQVQCLSQSNAQALLIPLREVMLYQATAFRETLKESWGFGKDVDLL
ncbi:NblA/ycf18 family protein [Nodosilinea sp. LEGE 07298]|uniref:NblA/ycf18 family protein n=1 Tax=Nodosilinea sp. LEGE 07298 TaxID=2777970 RepID=UPI0018807086|nr:NblA/ycf18 family protein [Nodosilinea sp. LEGE 07298]MBE9110956.1 NblA/ycf18 family protein [Nodosilinea sp. LEGE 07298]